MAGFASRRLETLQFRSGNPVQNSHLKEMAKLTQAAVEKALIATHGNICAAARRLKVDRRAISLRIAQSEELGQILTDARESMIDEAETSLARAVRAGEAWAVCFTLKTQGKERGYVERQEFSGPGGGPVRLAVVLDEKWYDNDAHGQAAQTAAAPAACPHVAEAVQGDRMRPALGKNGDGPANGHARPR